MSHRPLPPPVPDLPGYLFLLSQTANGDRQKGGISILSDFGPDWLGRQD